MLQVVLMPLAPGGTAQGCKLSLRAPVLMLMTQKGMRRLRRSVGVFAASFLVFSSYRAAAHEVPSELMVETFVRPTQSKLQLLIRVPLSGLLGTGMPKEGVGYLALDRIEPSLHRTALQIADSIDIYEGNGRLPLPQVVGTRIATSPRVFIFFRRRSSFGRLNSPGTRAAYR